MLTDDNKITAKAIAKECGIQLMKMNPQIGGVVCKWGKIVICNCTKDQQTAKQIGKPLRVDTIKDREKFDKIYPHLDVLAISRLQDKYALVTELLERGDVLLLLQRRLILDMLWVLQTNKWPERVLPLLDDNLVQQLKQYCGEGILASQTAQNNSGYQIQVIHYESESINLNDFGQQSRII